MRKTDRIHSFDKDDDSHRENIYLFTVWGCVFYVTRKINWAYEKADLIMFEIE